jgi:hypothetical protein
MDRPTTTKEYERRAPRKHRNDVAHGNARIGAACFAVVWGSAVVVAALWLKYAPPAAGTWLARVMAPEAVHIVAHLFLYGVLAALAWIATRRAWSSALIVAVFAIAQEAAQSIFWGRAFGGAEWFDLGVDSLAVFVVLATRRARSQRR